MKNTENLKAITALKLSLLKFKTLVENITDGLKTVESETANYKTTAYITHTEKADETETYNNQSITEILSEYFDTKVIEWFSHTNDFGTYIYIIVNE